MKAWTAIGVMVAVGAVVVAANAPAAMQAGQEFSAVSDTAAPDLAKLDYLLGEWNVRSFVRNDSGEFVESPTTSSFRVRYLYDGLSILAEFYGKRRDGFYGVHVITHDPERGLIHSYFNARANRRIEFEGTFRGDEYDLTRLGGRLPLPRNRLGNHLRLVRETNLPVRRRREHLGRRRLLLSF